MTLDSGRLDEWIVVLEFVPRDGGKPTGYGTLHAVVEELRAWHAAALFSDDRYALQLHLTAEQPIEAVRRSMVLHNRAVAAVGGSGSTLARIEVLTGAEFEGQWGEIYDRPGCAPRGEVLSNDLYWATRAMFRAATVSELANILVSFVTEVGGRIESGAPAPHPDKIVVDVSLEDSERMHAVADSLSVAGLIIEQSLPGMVADARAASARLRHPHPVSDSHRLPPY